MSPPTNGRGREYRCSFRNRGLGGPTTKKRTKTHAKTNSRQARREPQEWSGGESRRGDSAMPMLTPPATRPFIRCNCKGSLG